MKVLVNCFSIPPANKGGAGAAKYLQALLPQLSKLCDVSVFVSPLNKSDYDFKGLNLIETNKMSGSHSAFIQKNIVYFNPLNGFEPKDLGYSIPVVSLIHDYQHHLYPQWHAFKGAQQRNSAYLYEVMRSDAMICISEFEKLNLEHFYDANHGYVVHHAPFLFEQCKSSKPTQNPYGDYFLYPAMPWVHKNHGNLFSAFELIHKKLSADNPLKLICVGFDPDSEAFDLGRSVHEQLSDHDSVLCLGHVSDEELAHLMQNAKGLIFPSLYEGFGIPVVDAMAFGVPVLAANGTAIPEVTQDTVRYFRNAENVVAMAEDIEEFAQDVFAGAVDTTAAQTLARKYSVEAMAKRTFDVLKSTFDGKLSAQTRTLSLFQNAQRQSKSLDIIFDVTALHGHNIENQYNELVKAVGGFANILILQNAAQVLPDTFKHVPLNVVLNDTDKAFESAFWNLVSTSGQSDYVLYLLAEDAGLPTLKDLIPALANMHLDEKAFSSAFGLNKPVVESYEPLPEEKAIPQFRQKMSLSRSERLKLAHMHIYRREHLLVYRSVASRAFISKEALVGNTLLG